MNIHAKRFDKVIYSGGGEYEDLYLIKGNPYSVSKITGSSGSFVTLIEFPLLFFKTSLFEDATKEPVHIKEIMDKVLPEEFPNINWHEPKQTINDLKSEKDWSENLYIPRQTINRRSAFDDHFKIIGVLDRGVRKSKHLKFNNFDWNQLFNWTVSKHIKHGKEVEYETWHILSFIGDKKFTIIAERRR